MPTEYAAAVYDDLILAGADLGIRPGWPRCRAFGWRKGYRDMGVDIDITDNPIEAGLPSPSPGTGLAGSPAAERCSTRGSRPTRASSIPSEVLPEIPVSGTLGPCVFDP